MKIFDISNGKFVETSNIVKIAEFYVAKGYGNAKFINNYLQNSDYIFIVIKNDEIAGVIRTISDQARFAFLVDLFVSKKFRKQGIGTRLLKTAGDYYSKLKVCHIELTTDPTDPKLPEFYRKVGLVRDKGSEVFYYPWPKN